MQMAQKIFAIVGLVFVALIVSAGLGTGASILVSTFIAERSNIVREENDSDIDDQDISDDSSGQQGGNGATLPDGSYKMESGELRQYYGVGREFVVEGNTLTITKTDIGIPRFAYTFDIKNNEIVLRVSAGKYQLEDVNSAVDEKGGTKNSYSFKKESNTTYIIDGNQYAKVG